MYIYIFILVYIHEYTKPVNESCYIIKHVYEGGRISFSCHSVEVATQKRPHKNDVTYSGARLIHTANARKNRANYLSMQII